MNRVSGNAASEPSDALRKWAGEAAKLLGPEDHEARDRLLAALASQPAVVEQARDGWFLERSRLNESMLETLEKLIAHAKRARWTNVTVRKDAVETVYEADWIKWLTPIASQSTPPKFSCYLERDKGETPCAQDCGKLRCMYPSERAQSTPPPERAQTLGEWLHAAYADKTAPAPPPESAGQGLSDAEPTHWLVMAPCGEGVVFDNRADARWTKTGREEFAQAGRPVIGETFRECYGEEKLTLTPLILAANRTAQP